MATALPQHYVDPRLVALYDDANASGDDHDFYRALADRLDARRILDLGCGTGLLTRTLVGADRHVVGIDPAEAMLDHARAQPGAERVEWILGDAARLPGHDADLVLMTGNVAQVFIDDREWAQSLAQIQRSLRAGGTLAFESRNPATRPWETWATEPVSETETTDGPLREWLENVRESDGVVRLEGHNVFLRTGEHVVAPDALRFRSRQEIESSLTAAGFSIVAVFGDWHGAPLADDSPMMIFVSQACPFVAPA